LSLFFYDTTYPKNGMIFLLYQGVNNLLIKFLNDFLDNRYGYGVVSDGADY